MKKKLFGSAAAAFVTSASAMMSAVSAFADDASGTATASTAGPSFMTMVISLLFMFAILYFMAIKPQKKREQEQKEMQDSLQVGDEIVTSGGIVGIVVRTGDDTIVIETGGERHKLRIKKWAIAENVTANERKAAAEAANKKSASSLLSPAQAVDDTADSKKSKKKKSDEE
ncbi:MAG: preprotein translocase subunit YajC [Ruminococcus sp.]|nr:preprotein translocase subunit YajC [Ruminococcus sp.]